VNESGYYNQVNHQTSLPGDKGVLGIVYDDVTMTASDSASDQTVSRF